MWISKCPFCDVKVFTNDEKSIPSHGCVADDMTPEIRRMVLKELREVIR